MHLRLLNRCFVVCIMHSKTFRRTLLPGSLSSRCALLSASNAARASGPGFLSCATEGKHLGQKQHPSTPYAGSLPHREGKVEQGQPLKRTW